MVSKTMKTSHPKLMASAIILSLFLIETVYAELVFKYESDSISSISGPSAYAFDGEFTFTDCGKIGREGPSESQCLSAYSEAEWVPKENNFSVDAGIQRWKVPESGAYRFEIGGSRGGSPSLFNGYATGALVKGTLILEKGDVLKILVGQLPQSGIGRSLGNGGAGGGGTFVSTSDDKPLFVAGGAGGLANYGNTINYPKLNGTGTNQGKNYISEGRKGDGGGGGSYSASLSQPNHGDDFLSGGEGGDGLDTNGGFGGGGGSSTNQFGAGGGGYSGGDETKRYGEPHYGNQGGGGSFVTSEATDSQKVRAGNSNSDERGFVKITIIDSGS